MPKEHIVVLKLLCPPGSILFCLNVLRMRIKRVFALSVFKFVACVDKQKANRITRNVLYKIQSALTY